jgi:hypothetical protein
MHTYSRCPRVKSAQSGSARRLQAHDLRPFGFAKAQAVGCVRVWFQWWLRPDGQSCPSAAMLAAAVTAGVTSSAVRVPAASHVEAARTPAANGLRSAPATKQMEATRVRWFYC